MNYSSIIIFIVFINEFLKEKYIFFTLNFKIHDEVLVCTQRTPEKYSTQRIKIIFIYKYPIQL